MNKREHWNFCQYLQSQIKTLQAKMSYFGLPNIMILTQCSLPRCYCRCEQIPPDHHGNISSTVHIRTQSILYSYYKLEWAECCVPDRLSQHHLATWCDVDVVHMAREERLCLYAILNSISAGTVQVQEWVTCGNRVKKFKMEKRNSKTQKTPWEKIGRCIITKIERE